ncbi:MAG: GNAT family N-acetyltransferase [Chloroflexi bacterium]|nr:GNAT family N-acetyltransferase [Chloroflexota bacterium]
MPIFWNNHIGLRPFEEPLTDTEIEKIYHWSRDDEVLRWSGGAPTELTLDEFQTRLRGDQKNQLTHRRAFLIVLRSGQIIGRVGVFAIDWEKREGELGIAIGETTQWDKGYGREAIQLILGKIFQSTLLERIYLYTFPDNVRAQRCFAACGFHVLGTAQRFSPDLGEYDGVEMEITKRGWQLMETLKVSSADGIRDKTRTAD